VHQQCASDRQEDDIEHRTRVAPGASAAFESVDPGSGVGILHCEISSAVGTGAAIGAPIGAVAGVIAGAILCAALGWVTFGLACLLAILLGAILGETLGELIGAGIGAIADALSDFDRKGEGIERCCTVVFRGRWVTDTSHQHNEIHDIDSIQIVGCGVGSTEEGLLLAGAVGIGRIPTGRDPDGPRSLGGRYAKRTLRFRCAHVCSPPFTCAGGVGSSQGPSFTGICPVLDSATIISCPMSRQLPSWTPLTCSPSACGKSAGGRCGV
jgi:hypothetical protein